MDVARREEEYALGDRVVDEVEHGPEHAQPANADPEDQNAHVLDAGVGEHPLVVALTRHEDAGHGHREEADPDHELARERRLAARGDDLEEAQEREEGAAGERSGE